MLEPTELAVTAVNHCSMRNLLIAGYLEYRNSWLTIAAWAEHNGLTEEEARELHILMCHVCSHEHPDA